MVAQAVRLSNIDIDNALKKRDFELLFQPIFDLSNGALARVETFVRWRHQTLGLLPPGAFISFFETQGRMSELTRYVLEQALDSYMEWRGPYAPGFSINLALSDLTDDSFISHFNVLLREKGFPAELVTLECPMPPVDIDQRAAAANFERIASTGARLAIEVRGRANEFLRTIEPFPFAEIKTGGAAILRFARTVRGPGLSSISELLELAESRNAAITAVGVEDQASLAALKGLNFDAAQGNHLSRVGLLTDFKPARVNEIRALLDLEPLAKTDLAALFRTAPPSPESGAPAETSDAATTQTPTPKADAAGDDDVDTTPTNEDLVERLEARLSKNAGENAALIEKRKAAAIARAKMNRVETTDTALEDALKDPAPATGALDLQNRVSEAFTNASPQSVSAQGKGEAETAQKDAPGATGDDAPKTASAAESQDDPLEAGLENDEDANADAGSSSPEQVLDEQPEDASSQVTEPQVTKPQGTGPQTTAPQSTGPQTTGPQTTGPQTTGPQSTEFQGDKDAVEPAAEEESETPVDDAAKIDAGADAEALTSVASAVSSDAAAPSEIDPFVQVKRAFLTNLRVDDARAYFKSSLRVSSAGLATPEEMAQRFAPASLRGDRGDIDPGTDFEPQTDLDPEAIERAVSSVKGGNRDGAAAEEHETSALTTVTADDTADDEDAEASTARPVFVRFGSRKVYVYSGYFWPKSWRRAWRARAEREDTGATA